MQNIDRRSFIRKTSAASASVIVSTPLVHSGFARSQANETLNIAVIGIRSRGKDHYRALAKIPNVNISILCDVDQRLFPEAVAEVEKLTGKKPKTETEYRKVLDNSEIDAVTIATPNHWHALQTIWACQAGKHVYVEKPVSHTLLEGRKMIEAARKYNRIVQTGTQARSSFSMMNAMNYLHQGEIGDIYMAKGICLKPRGSIGRVEDGQIPLGVDWDTYRGPASYRPFNKNRFHYKWHWFWDTGNGDFGNQGIHQADMARMALQKLEHPIRIQGIGDYFVFDSDQETPNIQQLQFEYEDGKVLQFEVRGLPTNAEGDIKIGNLIYGSKGWLNMQSEDVGGAQAYLGDIQIQPSGYSSYKEEKGLTFTDSDPEKSDPVLNHFKNFIDCVLSGSWLDLNADILEGHLSTSLCHLGNIATRLKRTLNFNPQNEQFVDDTEADSYLTKRYRAPFLLPDTV
jgi:predicted dehydrogenase